MPRHSPRRLVSTPPCGLSVAWAAILAGCVAWTCGGCTSSTDVPGAGAGSSGPPVEQAAANESPEQLRERLDKVLALTQARRLNSKDHNAWQVVHGILAFGDGLLIEDGGKALPALTWVLEGGNLRGWNMAPGPKGLEAIVEPGTKSGQGHEDQWLGYLSQIGLDPERKVMVRGQEFKVADLVSQAQWDVHEGMEATWTLMALGMYLPLDAEWKAKDGGEWSIERLVAMEAAQDLAASSCGGTHRLYGMTSALNRYLDEGGKLAGGWLAADTKIQVAIRAAKEFQQPDGSFSSNFFQRASGSPDIARRINTTGHTLEFLTLALTDEQIREPWVARAVACLCDLLEKTKDMSLECGSLYHAAHGLQLYELRRFGEPELAQPEEDRPPPPGEAGPDKSVTAQPDDAGAADPDAAIAQPEELADPDAAAVEPTGEPRQAKLP